ncbi:MAG: hypothetical protein KAS93_06820 [Gammaproteobacteria bacterium]|nr:hypothetical protein [Gammaproteobacteria bacterium]
MLKFNLSFDSPILRSGIRGGIAAAIAVLIAKLIPDSHSYWIAITTLIVLQAK